MIEVIRPQAGGGEPFALEVGGEVAVGDPFDPVGGVVGVGEIIVLAGLSQRRVENRLEAVARWQPPFDL